MKNLAFYLVLYALTVAIAAAWLYLSTVFPESLPYKAMREFMLWGAKTLGRNV